MNNGTMTERTAQARTLDANRISGDSFRFAALEPGIDDLLILMTHKIWLMIPRHKSL